MGNHKPTTIWERLLTEPGTRKLDYGSITATAMALADRDGLGAVTMRNVASALGAGTMSLYRYVSVKDDLLDLMLDAAFGEISLPEIRETDWQVRLMRVALASRRMLKAHSWLAPLITSRPTLGPNYLNWFEYLLVATASPDRDIKTQMRIIGTVWSFVSGFVAYELGELESERKHKLTAARKKQLVRPYMARVLATGRYPYLGQFLKSGLGRPTDDDFRVALRAVLAGLASIS